MRLSPRSLVLVAALGSSCAQIIGLDDYEKVGSGKGGGTSTAGNFPEAGGGQETGGSMSTRGGRGNAGGKAGSSGGKAGSVGGETGSAGEDPGTGGISNRGGNGNTSGGTSPLEGGSGGAAGAAGDDGSGGTITGSGGTTSKGGTTATSGGTTNRGGTTGAGGTTNRGGTTGAGGTTSKGGTTGTGGTCPQTELLVDGYFDDASPAWQEEYDNNSYPLIFDLSTINTSYYADSSPYVAWLGGYGADDEPVLFSRVYQEVLLPVSAKSIEFECVIWIDTDDSTTARRDNLNVELLNQAGAIVGSFGYVDNTDSDTDYVVYGEEVDVSTLSGTRVFFNMSAEQNGTLATDFLVDSCTLFVKTCK